MEAFWEDWYWFLMVLFYYTTILKILFENVKFTSERSLKRYKVFLERVKLDEVHRAQEEDPKYVDTYALNLGELKFTVR